MSFDETPWKIYIILGHKMRGTKVQNWGFNGRLKFALWFWKLIILKGQTPGTQCSLSGPDQTESTENAEDKSFGNSMINFAQ